MKLKKSAFASVLPLVSVCLANQVSADAIRNVAGPVILDAYTDANPNIGTDSLSITLGSGNYNLPNSGNGNNAGRGLIIGEGNTLSTPNSHVAGYAMVTGYGNSIRVHGGIVGGYNNRISFDQSSTTNFGKFTSIFGISNIVHPGVQGSYASLVAGSQQRLTGDYSFLSGQENIVSGPSIGSETLNSVAMGATNTIASETAWTIGVGNILGGKEASAYGTGLSAIHRGVTVLGSYNTDPMVTGAGGLDLRTNYFTGSPLLVVGNGTAGNARSNALVLRRSGDLEVGGLIFQGGSPIATQSYATSVAATAISNTLSASVGMSGGMATGSFATALSGGSAQGYKSTAMSTGEALGELSVAMSEGYASGDRSIAIGGGYAAGERSFAMNWGYAGGEDSIVMGPGEAMGSGVVYLGGNGNANGNASVNIGRYNTADASFSVVLGAGGYTSGGQSWIETDSIFAIGNSYYPTNGPRNAITTLKNGQTTLTNKFWSSSSPQTIPTNATEASSGNALIVEGHSRLKGNTVMDGRVTITQVQGDINPGIYQ